MIIHLSNVPLKTIREYMKWKGLSLSRIKGGHEIWSSKTLSRPIVIQSHIDPVPEFIVLQIFRNLGVDRDDFKKFLES